MQMNPIQMLKMMQGSQNPMQMLEQQMGNNPMLQRAKEMCAGKSDKEIQQIAINLCQQRGINVNDAMAQFKAQMGK